MTVTRRSVLRGIAGGALALPALGRRLRAAAAPARETPALVVVYLNGGPAGLFNSAGSFLARGDFGVKRDNVRVLGGGLVVDAGSLGSLPASALGHMAAINFAHGLDRHDLARAALLQTGDRSNLLLLAQSFIDPAPVRCAVVNSLGLPVGVDPNPPTEGGIALERVLDLRAIGRYHPPEERAADPARLAAAYRVRPEQSAIDDPASSFLAAELLLRSGSNVVFTQPLYAGRPDRQIDTHHDATGAQARSIMATIMPPLRTFVGRALALPGRNVVIALVGEFSRTVGASDHEPGGTATVIGKYVRTGSAGPQTPAGAPPPGSPPPAGLWAYLAGVLRLPEHQFGQNPVPELVLGERVSRAA
ncbi:MAG TPA: hypothetical protein VKB80_10975 [Kofleriaceae bacterium]|nr:hypothetical protein [Kofleriaceae bacterium]